VKQNFFIPSRNLLVKILTQKIFYFFFKNPLTNRSICGIIDTERGRAKAQKKIKKKLKNFSKTS
jgi:hypothetical protein